MIEKLAKSLHPLERKILPVLKDGVKSNELVEESKLREVEVMRALQWLENKGVVKIKTEAKEIISLDGNGRLYLKRGLPEKRFLIGLENGERLSLEEIKKISEVNDDEVNISLGILKKKNAIIIGSKIRITKEGKELLKKESLEESFLKKLPLEVEGLTKEEKYAYNELKRRKEIIKTDLVKERSVFLTELGKKLQGMKLKKGLIESLSIEMLKDGKWKGKQFRVYDIKTKVPDIYFGKRHFVNQAIEYSRKIWMDLGFKEMKGPIINTSFWNFDALFVPQDHPARDLQDSIFLDMKGKLEDRKIVNDVKEMHENGGKIKSKGWRYRWSEEEAKKLVLRTHTTVLSARTLANLKKEDLPCKYFAIGRNYRNETISWSHLFEFNQTEGIVVSEDVNFRHLLGYLKEFFEKMGFEKVRFRPAYFPYTFCSVEPEVFHPIKKKWIELGGAGIFRPEVTKPLLGFECPVLAWGLGLGRIIMDYYNITDIRELYKNDLKQLREIKMWLK